jgi:hypothetical protein
MHRTRIHPPKVLVAGIVALSVLLPFWTALAQPGPIDPEAGRLLQTSLAFLAGQQRFRVETRSTLEVVLDSGQKIQFDHAAALLVQRPDKLRAERRGDIVDQVLTYDGTSLTLYNPGDNVFATVRAPGTIEEMLDFARDSLDIVAPAGDLIYRNALEILMADTTEGIVVGKSVVEGLRCDHLAFRGPEVDWQIWVQEGGEPLPRKFLITTRDVPGLPQFAVVMTDWELAPEVTDEVFGFTPPAGATAVGFVPIH